MLMQHFSWYLFFFTKLLVQKIQSQNFWTRNSFEPKIFNGLTIFQEKLVMFDTFFLYIEAFWTHSFVWLEISFCPKKILGPNLSFGLNIFKYPILFCCKHLLLTKNFWTPNLLHLQELKYEWYYKFFVLNIVSKTKFCCKLNISKIWFLVK